MGDCGGKICAFIGGGTIGVLVSWVVNCTLAEISLNSFFSLYFGILFAGIGMLILVRVCNSKTTERRMQPILVTFALLVITSGILCTALDQQWFHFSATVKVPLYAIVGMSVCFAFTFSFLDMINLMIGMCNNEEVKALVESRQQVNLILGSSMAMGAAFGLIFGLMDVEDKRGLALRDSLIQEERYCIPVGVVLGGLTGLGNHIMRHQAPRVAFYHHNDNDDI